MRLGAAALVVLAVATSALALPKPEAVLRKEAGNLYLKQREFQKAKEEYLAALKVDPDYADAHYNLGVVYFFRLQDYPRALYHFVRYARLRPDASDLGQVKALAVQALEKVETAEREAYGAAVEAGTVEALQEFVRGHPDSPYVEDARAKIRLLQEYEEGLRGGTKQMTDAYRRALDRGTIKALESFLTSYPDSPDAEEARRLKAAWEQREFLEEEAYRAALGAGTTEALGEFLQDFPGSPLAAQVRARIEELRAAEEAYGIAAEARSIPALDVFLASHSGTPWEGPARDLLETLRTEEAERRAREAVERESRQATERRAQQEAARLEADLAWDEVAKSATAAAYEEFSTRYPDHPMAEEARRRAASLQGEPPALPEPEAALPPPPAPHVPLETAPPALGAPGAVDPAGEAPPLGWNEVQSQDTGVTYPLLPDADLRPEEAASPETEPRETGVPSADPGQELPQPERRALQQYRKILEN